MAVTSMAAPRAAQQGFTLIEVMIAIMLMAVLSVVSWQGLGSVADLREHFDRDYARDQALMRALGQLDVDVRLAAPDHVIDGGALPAGSGAPRLLPAAIGIEQDGTRTALRIVRPPSGGDGAWQEISWWRDGSVLRRGVPPAANEFPLPRAQQGDPVLADVLEFSVRAYVPGRGWQALSAQASGSATAATGLEFTLAQGPSADQARRYRRVVALP